MTLPPHYIPLAAFLFVSLSALALAQMVSPYFIVFKRRGPERESNVIGPALIVVILIVTFLFPLAKEQLVVQTITFFFAVTLLNLFAAAPFYALGREAYEEAVRKYYAQAPAFRFWSVALAKLILLYVPALFAVNACSSFSEGKLFYVGAIGNGLCFTAMFLLIIDIYTRVLFKRQAAKDMLDAQ